MKTIYKLLFGTISLFLVALLVYAYGGSSPSVHGHNLGELDNGGWYVPSDIKETTATNNGNFGGYAAMNTWIQSNGCNGYHVCDAIELTRYEQVNGPVASTGGWYITGVEARAGDDTGAFHDCARFTSTANSGSVWPVGYAGTELACSSSTTVMCCK